MGDDLERGMGSSLGLPLSTRSGESVSAPPRIERASPTSERTKPDSRGSDHDYDAASDSNTTKEEAGEREENSCTVVGEKDSLPSRRETTQEDVQATFPPPCGRSNALAPTPISLATTPTFPPPSTSFATTSGIDSLASSQRPLFPPAQSSSFLSHFTPKSRTQSSPSTTTKSSSKSTSHKQLISLGYTGATLKRDYDFWSAVSISICNIGFLPGTFLGVLTAAEVGGSSMYTIGWPIAGLFMLGLVAVLAEMASTYPVAGAMFTWSFRLCRSSKYLNSSARYISWLVGSMLLCAHLLTQIVLTYQVSHMLQGIIEFHTPFEESFWKTMAFGWSLLVVCGLIVSSPISRSPRLWKLVGISIFVSFLAVNVILLTQAPEIRSASTLFSSYSNDTGINSRAYVYLIGTSLTCLASGSESCAHIAEDTKRPTRNVPLAMFWSVALSYIFGWISICILLATTVPEAEESHLWGPIGLIGNTVPRPYATTIFLLILFSMFFQNIAQLLATSRYIWALARESALPFSAFFKILTPRGRLPRNATWFIVGCTAPAMLLLAISARVVGTIILAATAWTTIASYLSPVVLYLMCEKDALVGDGRNEWTLRGWSRPVAWAVVPIGIALLIVLCFPTGYPITSLTAPYSPAVAFGVVFLSSLSWIFYGNARYAGPIKTTTLWTLGVAAELPRSAPSKSSTFPGSTSAAHGQTAHIFSSFPTLLSGDGSAVERSRMRGGEREREDGEREGEESEWTGGDVGSESTRDSRA